MRRALSKCAPHKRSKRACNDPALFSPLTFDQGAKGDIARLTIKTQGYGLVGADVSHREILIAREQYSEASIERLQRRARMATSEAFF
jgi:hypothetical protein